MSAPWRYRLRAMRFAVQKRNAWVGLTWSRQIDLGAQPPTVDLWIWICLVPFLPLVVVFRRDNS